MILRRGAVDMHVNKLIAVLEAFNKHWRRPAEVKDTAQLPLALLAAKQITLGFFLPAIPIPADRPKRLFLPRA